MDRIPKSILLTGGCGFIGSNLAHWLVDKTDVKKIVVLDCLTDGSDLRNISDSASFGDRLVFVKGEFGDRTLVTSLLNEHDVDSVLHLAGETHVDRSYTDPLRCTQINVMQLIPLLEACNDHGKLLAFLHMSTDEVYGDLSPLACDEKSPFNPTNPYAASKAASEQFVRAFYHSFGLPILIMRCNNVYGPRQASDKVVPRFIQNLLLGRQISLHGGGKQTRNWLHVDDVCSAYWAVLTRGKIGDAYNIGSTDEVAICDLAEILFSMLQRKGLIAKKDELKVSNSQDRPHNDRFYHIAWDKIASELGWKPQVSFSDGIDRVVEWYVKKFSTTRDEDPYARFLVFGHAGWIGSMFMRLLARAKIPGIPATTRPGFDEDSKVEEEIDRVAPTHVVSLLGRTHGPGCSTIDFLEGGPEKLRLNVRDNLYAPVLLALLCGKRKIHVTYLGTGCIFEYSDDGKHRVGGDGYKEDDVPTFFGSSYSVVKGYTDRIMHNLGDSVLNLRIRMPVSGETNPRNFVTKIANYDKVIDVPNSVTVLPEMLPIALDMALDRQTGTVNLVNPHPISHNEVLGMYKELVDPELTIRNFTEEEQSKVLKAGRSNCALSTNKLESMYEVDDSRTAVRKCLESMAAEMK